METKSKIALVTGGSRGLGRNMAIAIAKKGLDVVITYNANKEAADEVVNEIRSLGRKALALQLDTSNSKNFESFASQLSTQLTDATGSAHIDYLVNNAGTALYSLATDTLKNRWMPFITFIIKAYFSLHKNCCPS